MSQCPSREVLEKALAGQLSGAEEDAICSHLKSCAACASTLEMLSSASLELRASVQGRSHPGDEGCEAFLRRLIEAGPPEEHVPLSQDTKTLEAAGVLSFLDPPSRPDGLGRLGEYEVVSIVGQGGMGTVFKAFDASLHRVVAIKVLAPHLASGASARQRFLREARAAAAVSHEHVVTIHGVVEDGKLPYLVMQHVAGVSLQQRLDRCGALGLKEVLRIGMQTAAGLAALHAQGLVHRDVTPANILLENGIERVKITDFGLARSIDDVRLTGAGVVVGTPLYMSPEQAQSKPVDHRSDLFSLGSVLYTLCTGQPPFQGDSSMAVLRQVCFETPPPIRSRNPNVSDELVRIITRLHAKDPAGRIQSARELAAMLEQQLATLQQPEPGRAPTPRPSGSRPRGKRIVLAVSVLLLLVAGSLSAYWMRRSNDARTGSNPAQPEVAPFVPPPPLSAEQLARLPSPLDGRKHDAVPLSLRGLAGGGDPEKAPPELVGVLADGRFLLPQAGRVGFMDQSPDGKLLAVPHDNDVVLFDVATGARLRTLKGPGGTARRAAFSPDGRLLALYAGDDDIVRGVRVWETADGREVHTQGGAVTSFCGGSALAFSPDSERLLSGGTPNVPLQIWEARTGRVIHTLRNAGQNVSRACFHPGGRRCASADFAEQRVTVWDADTGEVVRALPPAPHGYLDVCFSPNGKRLAAATGHQFTIWDADSLEEVRTCDTHADWLAFTPDSRTLWTGDFPGEVTVVHTLTRWDVASGKKVGELPVKGPQTYLYAYLRRDGKMLIASNGLSSPYLRVFDLPGGEEWERPGHTGAVHAVSFSPDGKLLASAGADRVVRLWNLAGWEASTPLPPLRVLGSHTDSIWSIAFSRDGALLASASTDATIVLWDVARGKEVRTLPEAPRKPARLAFSPDGRTLAIGQEDGSLQLWDVATGQSRSTPRRHEGAVSATAFSPDGKYLISAGGRDGSLQLLESDGGRLLRLFRIGSAVINVAFSPDSRMVAASTTAPDAAVYLWDVESKKETILRGHSGPVATLAFHPAGQIVASGGLDGTVRLWNRGDGAPTRVFGPGPFGKHVYAVAFTPEGRYLAVASDSGIISLLRLASAP